MHPLLQAPDRFIDRHIGPSAHDLDTMLSAIGVDSLDELIAQAVPAAIRRDTPLHLPHALTETELLAHLRELAGKNKLYKSYIGMGYTGTVVPPVVLRNVLENPAWYTQYTPYQAEIAQGRLEALLNYQTMVCDLTGMELANASLLDEATAAAEALHMFFALRDEKKQGTRFYVHDAVHPQTLAVLQTRAEPLDVELVVADPEDMAFSAEFFGAVIQCPTTDGLVWNYRQLIAEAHAVGAKVAVASDLLALTLVEAPGQFGADCVLGSAQRFGVPMGYGGPHAAFFATREEFKRHIPGRLVGVSQDTRGKRALRLALQTREQHIKRERATSNICTAQVLLAIMSSMYAVYHGPQRLKAIAERVHFLTGLLAQAAKDNEMSLYHQHYFDTLRLHLGDNAGIKQQGLRKLALEAGYNLRYYDDLSVGITLDETTTLDDVASLAALLHKVASTGNAAQSLEALTHKVDNALPADVQRQSPYLTHEVFNRYHAEHEMLRYIRTLEKRDLSLTTSMIPLGSCTMKLNATAEMLPITWPEWGGLHPFVPVDQAQGYHAVFKALEKYLAEICEFSAVSLQPNSGAQGEYTGLMVIRAYLQAKGQGHRNVALIPASAHGTNPASAVMAGMQVVVVKTDAQGNIDLNDLKAKADQHREKLACLMVTYPSTHGVFEATIKDICATIHEAGGQVYMDGANLNAQVGLTSPGRIGADVCHINLHKTFCIPHGGGGPGMGPIAVASHLAPYLPGHPVVKTGGEHAITPVSAAPWGSASILLISYAYIRMMGGKGLKSATEYAILNANYLKARLAPHYALLYEGAHGRVAHEFILDMRGFKTSAKVEVEDVAKRLIDYSYHAPTVSFPVPGTMMIEPTESESLHELDRFVEAMIAIRHEIEEVATGQADADHNVLKNAPHTADQIASDEWAFPYSRQKAVYPLPYLYANKFWPFVTRVNNSLGDRQLICTCPPLEAYA